MQIDIKTRGIGQTKDVTKQQINVERTTPNERNRLDDPTMLWKSVISLNQSWVWEGFSKKYNESGQTAYYSSVHWEEFE